MTDEVKQDATPEAPATPQVTERQVTNEERIHLMRQGIMQTAWNFAQSYRNFLKQLPIEPGQMASLLDKHDSSWFMARVVIEDMQITLNTAA